MKTRINKILSVLAVVALLASSFVWAAPVAASTPGDGQFTLQDAPGAGTAGKNVIMPGSTIKDISVGSDGKTIWVAHASQADGIQLRVTGGSVVPPTAFPATWGAGNGVYTVTYTNLAGASVAVTPITIIGGSALGTIVTAGLPAAGVLAVTGVTTAVGNAAAATDKFIVQGVTNGLTYASVAKGTIPAATDVTYNTIPTVKIFKSSDAGQSFDDVTNTYVTSGVQPVLPIPPLAPVAISVAPDDVNTCAVTDGTNVIITKDGGTTWSALPAALVGVWAGARITDIAVCPLRSGTDREYVISLADPAPGATCTFVGAAVTGAAGDVLIFTKYAWASVGANTLTVPASINQVTGELDFTSVVVTPNYLGDRCVVAVGTKIAAGSTALLIINADTKTVIVGGAAPVPGVPLLASGAVTDVGSAATATTAPILSSSIALPTNFDPMSSSGRRAYVGIASALNLGTLVPLVAPAYPADNNVYRVTDKAVKTLELDSTPIYSIAYSGTTDTGILFMGPMASTDIQYTTGMTGTPSWVTTLKGPTSAAAAVPNVIVKLASDYATTSRVFASTIGAESALYVSNDAGVSFVAESLIDTGATDFGGSPSFAFSSDAKTLIVSAKDSNNYITIWQTAVPFDATSWKRIFSKPVSAAGLAVGASGSLKTSGTALFFFESVTLNGVIYVSQDSGVSWSNRNGPSGARYATAAARDTQTLYYVDTTGNVYKSTNAGWTWSAAVASGVGGTNQQNYSYSCNLPKANQVIVAANGVAISNDDGATFTAMASIGTVATPPGQATAGTGTGVTVTADTNYATNSIIYAADTGGLAASTVFNIYRVNTNSTSNPWELLSVPSGLVAANIRILGLTCKSGLLYATTSAQGNGVLRTLYPTDIVGSQNWKFVCNGLTGALGAGVSTTTGINLYGRVGNAIYAFNDFLATTKPTLTEPADNYADAVNPQFGNGYAVDLKWKPMGTGSGQVDQVDIEIVDKANGFTGTATVSPTISATNPLYTTVQTLQPNKVYLWRVRAARTTFSLTSFIDSPWSDARTINIQAGSAVSQQYAGPVLLGPQGGAQNLDPNLVGFAWAPVSGATEYTVIVATDAALTKAVSGTPAKVTVPAYQATGLAYGTTYFWAVQATKPTSSIQTMGTFTTMQKPVAAATAPATGAAAAPPQTIIVQPTAAETPAYIWAVIAIGAILVIAVIILIVRTRRVP